MDQAGPPARITRLPCWRGAIRAERMRGGLSNEAWKVEDEGGAHVARFGADLPHHHVSRDRERAAARAAAALGFAPAVEWTGGDAMVTAFVTATTWDAGAARASPERLGRLIRAFHDRVGRAVAGAPALFDPHIVARDYARTLEGTRHAGALSRLVALAEGLEGAQPPMRLVFGHNDLLPANVLDDGERLWLIDYEYAAWASPLFDLAGAASNAAMGEEEAEALIGAYLGAAPDEGVRRAVAAMAVSSLLREHLWAMVSEAHPMAEGVDYGAYVGETGRNLEAGLRAFEDRWGRL